MPNYKNNNFMKRSNISNLTTRQALEQDMYGILDLFVHTISFSCQNDYTHKQINAWVSSAKKPDPWLQKINDQYFPVILIENQIVGFGSLRIDGYIDFLYVDYNLQKKGIGSYLYNHLESNAIESNITALTSDVSITALPFFQNKGFIIIKEQYPMRQNILLKNFKMIKKIR